MTAENDPGQLFRAVGDITKHNDISHISQINRSKSFKQFREKTWFLFLILKKIHCSIRSSVLRGLHLPGHLRLRHGRRHPQHPSYGASWERCKYHVTMCFQGKDVSAKNQSRCYLCHVHNCHGNTDDNSFRVKDYGTLACGLSDMFSHSLVNGHCICNVIAKWWVFVKKSTNLYMYLYNPCLVMVMLLWPMKPQDTEHHLLWWINLLDRKGHKMPALIHHRRTNPLGAPSLPAHSGDLRTSHCRHFQPPDFASIIFKLSYSGGCIFIFPGYGIVIRRKMWLSQQHQWSYNAF